MKISLLGFTVPDELLAYIHTQDDLLQTQTHRFAWSLVRALRDNDVEVELLSAAPVSDFPSNRRILWGRSRFERDGVAGLLLPFVNLTVLKHVTRFLSCWFFAMPQLRRFRPDWLLVHGVHSPFLWFAVAMRSRAGVRVATVLTDPPGVLRPEDGLLKSLLKRVDIAVVTSALKRCDAVIVLAEPLARDFAPGVPYVVVEGLLNTSAMPVNAAGRAHVPRTVVFAGGLQEEYGVKNLVEGFEALDQGSARLELYGKGALESWIAGRADADVRIQRSRLVPPEDLPGIYGQATLLVQPRQVDQTFVPYSFPSKLIEYMASGTVVVSTRLPSIPADYEPYVVWSDDDATSLRSAMDRVFSWSDEERASFGARASAFVRESRSTTAQGTRIVDFLDGTGAG